MTNTRIYDRAPLKDVRVKEPQVGRVRTPQILMSRKGGDYQKGDILDGNTTALLIKSIHEPDIKELNEKIDEARAKIANAVTKDTVGVAGGVASLDASGNVPVGQLGNVDVDIFVITDSLPTEDIKDNKIYCIKDTDSEDGQNVYVEYAHLNGVWEKIGEFKADPDLSQYARLDKENTFAKKVMFNGGSGTGSTGLEAMGVTKLEYLTIRAGITNNTNSKDYAYLTDGTFFDVTTLLPKADYQTDKANLTAAITNANTAADRADASVASATTATANANAATAQALKVNAELSGNVLTVTNNQGVQKSVNLTDSDEHITINMISRVDGVSLVGEIVNVTINNAGTPTQYTTNENSQIEFTVTKGATYKIVFPDVYGCSTPGYVEHIASVGSRIIDAVYEPTNSTPEQLKIVVTKHALDGTVEAYPNITVKVTLEGEDAVEHTTDSNGVIELEIPYGVNYTVEAPTLADHYVHNNKYTHTYLADTSSRLCKFEYYLYRTGVFIVTDTGAEYTLDEWKAGSYDTSTAKLIKFSNEHLVINGAVIYMQISDFANKAFVSKQWCTTSTLFTSVASDGYSTSDSLYYKGKESCELIMEEADNNGLEVPAFTYAKSLSVEVAGKSAHGYIGSVGQWIDLWVNREEIDDILQTICGENVKLFSSYTDRKWTSTQCDAYDAWGFNTAPCNFGKAFSSRLVPFFAY